MKSSTRIAPSILILAVGALLSAQIAPPLPSHCDIPLTHPDNASWEPPGVRVGPRDARAERQRIVRSGVSQPGPSRPAPWAPTRFAEHVPVELRNGQVHLVETDLRVESRGLPFVWSRTYESHAHFDGELGHNWTHPFARRIVTLANGNVVRIDGLGREDEFVAPAPGTNEYVAPRGVFATLKRQASGRWVETLPSGLRFTYSRATNLGTVQVAATLTTGGTLTIGGTQTIWNLKRVKDSAGNTMTVVRTRNNQISEIIDTQDRIYRFTYAAGRIVSIVDFAGREVVYEYDAAGDLVRRRSPLVVGTPNGNDFPAGKTKRYSYSSGPDGSPLAHNLVRVIEPRFLDESPSGQSKPWVTFTYSPETDSTALDYDRVISARWGHDTGGPPSMPAMQVGGTVSFAYEDDLLGDSSAPANAVDRTTEVSPAGDLRHHYFDVDTQQLRLIEFTNRDVRPTEGDWITDWTYDDEGLLIARVMPRGNRVEFAYDTLSPSRRARGNLLEVRLQVGTTASEPDLVTRYTYDPVFQQLRTRTDARAFPGGAVPLDSGGALDLTNAGVGRYTTTWIYDYQEGTGFQAAQNIPTHLRIPEGLGDRNGAPDFDEGNVVEFVMPTIETSGPNQGETSAEQRVWNEGGQRTATIDPMGIVTGYAYFPTNGVPDDASDREGYLASMTEDAAGSAPRLTQFEYDTRGNLTARIDPKSQRTDLHVNELDQTVRRESPAVGGTTRYITDWIYDLNDDLVRVDRSNIDADGAPYAHAIVSERFEYDILHHRAIREQDASRNDASATTWVRYETRFNAEGEQAARIAPAPSLGTHASPTITTFVYDERGLPYKRARGDDDVVPGNPLPAEALVATWNYDGNRNLIERLDTLPQASDTALPAPATLFPGSAPGDVVIQNARDGFDRLTRTVDGEGTSRAWGHDAASNVVSAVLLGSDGSVPPTAKLLHEINRDFDEANRPVRELVTHVDSNGQPIGNGARTTTFHYDLNGRPVQSAGQSGHFTQMVWENTRLAKIVDGLANEWLFDYDENGNVTNRTMRDVFSESGAAAQDFAVEFEYDALDRPVRRENAMAETLERRYDSRGNIVETRDARVGQGVIGNRVLLEYDALNRLVRTERILTETGRGDGAEVASVVTHQQWDADSLLRSRRDGSGHMTRYSYDEVGRLTTTTHPDGSVHTFGYNADGQRSSWSDPNGTSATVLFDARGRPLKHQIVPGAGVLGTTFEHFFYDGAGRLARVENDDVFGPGPRVAGFEYDSHGNRTREIQGGLQVTAEFDAYGNRLRVVYPGDVGGPGAWTLDTTYDVLGRPLTSTGSSSGSPGSTPIARHRYRGMSRLESRTYGDDALPTVAQQLQYDDDQRPTAVSFTGGWGSSAYQYAFEGTNRPSFEKRLHDAGAGEVFDHDSLGRLAAEKRGDLSPYSPGQLLDTYAFSDDQSTSWAYNPVGGWTDSTAKDGVNVATTTYVSGDLAEYGSLTSGGVTEPFEYDAVGNLTATVDQRYAYDALGRLVEVRDVQGALIELYGYDGLGRRVQTAGQGGGPHVRIFSGSQCVEERGTGGQVLHQYVWSHPASQPSQSQSYLKFTFGDALITGVQIGEPPGIHSFGDVPLDHGNATAIGGTDLLFVNNGDGSDFFDDDTDVDGFDFLAWQRQLPPSATHDSAVDGADFLAWQRQLPPSATHDSDVDGADFLEWQRELPPSAAHDLNSDGLVGMLDIGPIQEALGSGVGIILTSNSRSHDHAHESWIDLGIGGNTIDTSSSQDDGWILVLSVSTPVPHPSPHGDGRVILDSMGTPIDLSSSQTASDALGMSTLLSVRSSNGSFFALVDGRRNVTGMVDEAGNLVEDIRYSAFGSSTQSGSASGNEYKYVSVRRFPMTGLYQMEGRDYDPELGRFLQRDPRGAWAVRGHLGNGYTRDGNQPVRSR